MLGRARAIATTVAAAALVLPGAAAPAAADRTIVLSKGHIDLFEVTYDDATDALRLQVKDDSELYGDGTQFHDPADVLIAVDEDGSELTIPDGLPDSFDFLGDPGDVVYRLPETQDENLPWPGWSTERLPATLPAGVELPENDAVELAIEIDGPGDVFTFMNSPFGEPINRYVDTSDAAPDIIPVGRRAHVHTEWVFTELGEYTLTVTPTATTTGGGTIAGPAEEYVFRIGDEVAPPVKATSKTKATVTPKRVDVGKRARIEVVVDVLRSDVVPGGRIVVLDGTKRVAERTLSAVGKKSFLLPKLAKGTHPLTVRYVGTRSIAPSVSNVQRLVVVPR